MKISITFLLLSVLGLQLLMANDGYGQGLKDELVTLEVKGKQLPEVLQKIEEQTDYRFAYNASQITGYLVDLERGQRSLEETLNLILAGKPLRYKVVKDKFIVLRLVEKRNQSTVVPLLYTNKFGTQILKPIPLNVSGTVTDEEGEPLIGVNVQVKGTNKGTATDFNGMYEINDVNGNAELVFSYIGYQTQEIMVEGKSTINVIMLTDAQMLDEVVVVGYGKEKKVNLTGSVSSVSGNEIAKRQVGQTSQVLQGLMAGVTVRQNSGQPGIDGGSIRIRGIGTLNDANPLVLVDGIEMSMDNIDVSTIQSISVLKDAASAAIYGSKAANGVILITTKRGSSGKLSASYSSYVGYNTPTNLPSMVNGLDHITLINEAYTNAGRLPLYSDNYVNEYKANVGSDEYPDEDWQKAILTGSGVQTGHTLNLSGGSDVARIFASLGYLHQDGLLKTTKYERYFARINSNIELSKKLNATVDLFVSHQKRDATSQFPGGQAAALSPQSTTGSNLIFAVMNKFPANKAATYSNGDWGEGQNGVNPVAILEEGGFWEKVEVPVQGNLALEYKPWDFLTAKFNYSISLNQPQVKSFVNSIQTYTPDGLPAFLLPAKNYLDQSIENQRQDVVSSTLNFSKMFYSHSVNVLAGYQYENTLNNNFSAFRDNFLFNQYTVMTAGSLDNMQNGGSASALSLISYFGRFNYNYLGKYLFEANMRYDGSSRFKTGHQWGLFPSFAVGWRLSEESFMSSLKSHIQNIKIRTTWGRLGNQNIGGRYPFASTLTFGANYVSNGIVQDGLALEKLAATDISWETTEMTNLGVDFTIFTSLSGTFDYYIKKTTGILLELNIPETMGLAAPFQNAGVVQNVGWDFELNYRNSIKKLKYDISVSLSDVKNKILDLHGIQNNGVVVNHEGYPINSLYLYKAAGLISSKQMDDGTYIGATQFEDVQPGDVAFEDLDGNGKINISDKRILGSTIPRYTYGANFNFGWQNFDLSLLFQGVGKQDGYLSGSAIQPFQGGGTAYEYQKNRWTKDNPNPDAVFPRLFFSGSNNYQPSNRWVRSAAYLRVKNIQLGYSVPSAISSKRGINELRIYVSGENLFTVDKFWPGWDPEISANSSGAYYPQVKNYNIGLNLKF